MDITPSFTFSNITDALLTSYVLMNQDVYPVLTDEYVLYFYYILA